MKPNDLPVPDVEALVRFGQLGMQLFAVRLLSFTSLCGFLALAAYVAHNHSWVGACVTAIAALVFVAALKAETARRETAGVGT